MGGYVLSRPIQVKITHDHVMFIDDLKMFSASDKKLYPALQSTQSCMEDLNMEWNAKKCAVMNVKRGVLDEKSQVKFNDSTLVHSVTQERTYKLISGHSGTSWSRCNHNPWESYKIIPSTCVADMVVAIIRYSESTGYQHLRNASPSVLHDHHRMDCSRDPGTWPRRSSEDYDGKRGKASLCLRAFAVLPAIVRRKWVKKRGALKNWRLKLPSTCMDLTIQRSKQPRWLTKEEGTEGSEDSRSGFPWLNGWKGCSTGIVANMEENIQQLIPTHVYYKSKYKTVGVLPIRIQ